MAKTHTHTHTHTHFRRSYLRKWERRKCAIYTQHHAGCRGRK